MNTDGDGAARSIIVYDQRVPDRWADRHARSWTRMLIIDQEEHGVDQLSVISRDFMQMWAAR